jgi:hypothetical protein
MKVTDEMVAKATAAVPHMTEETVRQMLEAALSGSIIMIAGQGHAVANGKSEYPDYMQIEVSDTYVALDLARQLISAVQQQPGANTLERPALLLVAGEAGISDDD